MQPDAAIRIAWDDVALDTPERDALGAAARALTNLGRSESLCTASLDAHPLAPSDADAVPAALAPDDPAWAGPDVPLWTVDPREREVIDLLGVSVTDLRKAKRLIPEGIVPVPYRVRTRPSAAPPPDDAFPRPTIAHLRLTGPDRPAFADTVSMSATLRAAVQSRFGSANDRGVSSVLSGHAGDGTQRADQHRHAHYLTGHDRDSRRIDHLWIWAPEGFGPAELAAITSATRLSWRPTGQEPARLRAVLVGLGTEETLTLPDLTGLAHGWRSVTPFVLPRHEKRRAGRIVDGPEDQIQRELTHRGLPRAASVTPISGPWLDFSQRRPGKPHRHRRAIGVEVVFDEPIRGPLVLGALCHFGMGRFRPM